VGLWECVFALCGTLWSVFEGVSVCCVWESLLCVWEIECFVCGGGVPCGFGRLRFCCAWDSLVWVFGSGCVLYVGQICVGLGK